MSETKNRNKTRLVLSICLCLLLFIMAFALFGCANKSNSGNGENSEQSDVIDADAILKYDTKEISLETLKSVKLDNSIVVDSAVKKNDSYKSATFKSGLPTKTGNYWIRLTFADKTTKVIWVTVIDTSYRIEEIEVVYNQGTRNGYFNSVMDTSEIEFEVVCIVGKETVDGTATLDEDKLDPAISTYHYTFVPDEAHASLGNLTGVVEIEVYATVVLFMGDYVFDHYEVPYNSNFEERGINQQAGYERPYWADANNNKFTSQTKVTGDIQLYYHEEIRTFTINYHLNGSVNAQNPESYTIMSSSFALMDPYKENYRFLGWFTESNFAPESQIAYLDVTTLTDYELYAKFESIKSDPVVNIAPLNLVYTGQAQSLASITVQGGTLYYYYNGGNNSKAPTGTKAGEYDVTYWVSGDEFHFDVEKTTIQVTIARAHYDLTTYTFEDETVVYDGNPHSIEFKGTRPYGVNFKYIGSGTDVGVYPITMWADGVDTENYEIIEDQIAYLTIEKADPTYTAPTIKSLTYSGSAQALLNAGSTGDGSFVYSLDGTTWIDTIPTNINAGEYSVYYKLIGDKNHKDVNETLAVTIAKATYDMSGISFANDSKVYNRSAQGLEITGTLPNGVEVSYQGAETNVGEHTITAIFTGDANNYNAIENMTAVLTITKATLSSTIPTGIDNLVYTGSAQALVEGGTIDFGTIEYSLDGETFAEAVASGTNAATYNVSYKFVYDVNNYNADNLDGSFQVTIAKADLTRVSVDGYTGKYVAGSRHDIASVLYGSTVDSSVITWEYRKDSGDWTSKIEVEEINDSTASGHTYQFRATAANHNSVIGEVIVSITAKEAASIIITNIDALSKVYDGLTIATPVVSTDADNDGAQTISYSGGSIPKNAGIYTITVEIAECTNYALTTKTFTIEITKATLSVSGIVIVNKTYDGNVNATIANAGSLSGVVNSEAITLDANSVTATFKSANASNNAEVVVQGYSVSGSTVANYTFSTTWTAYAVISKAPVSITAPTAKSLSYTGASQSLVNAGVTTGTITYNLNSGTYSATIPSATNAGTYNVGYKFDIDATNYDTSGVDTTGTVVVTIAKATVTYTLPTANTLTYTASAQDLVTAGTTNVGSIEYSLNNGTYSNIVPKGTTAGSYAVKYKFVCDTNNYAVPSETTITVSIAKATPSYTTPTGLETIQGRQLSEVALPTGFTFEAAGTTSVGAVGNNTFTVKYTPSDTTNYLVVNGINVTIHVLDRYQLVIECTSGQTTTYSAGTQGPSVTVKANNVVITTGFTLSYSYKLNSASSYTSGLPKNAGTYNIKINATGYDYSDAIEVTTTYTINKAVLNVTATTISINYNASARTWNDISGTIKSGVTYSGLKSGDTTSITVNGMHNGKYKYGTVAGSYIAPTASNTFGSSYNNVIGSTYLAYFTQSNDNYTLSKDYVLVKYKTATAGSTYYTIEDALAASGTITFPGDKSSATSYVATMFSCLDTSYTGYATTYEISNRTLIVPYTDSTTECDKEQDVTSGLVYSALLIPNGITLNLTSSAIITAAAFIGFKQQRALPNTTITCDRGVIVNDGTINVASGCKINAYGFIKGSGSINLASGSTALDVLCTYDWPGGNTASSIKDTVLPLNAWSLHNISCSTKINSGAKYNAQLYAYVSSDVWTTVCIVSNSTSDSPMFVLSSGYVMKSAIKAAAWSDSHASAIALYSVAGLNQIPGQKDVLEMYGTCVDSSLTISVSALSLSTSTSVCCPMGYTDIYIRSGALTLSKTDFLFMPGTKLVVDQGATLTTNSGVDLAFEFVSNMDSARDSQYAFKTNCVDRTDAYLEVKGTFICKGNLGGTIKAGGTSAILNLASATLTSTHKSLCYANGASATSAEDCAYMISGMPAQGLIGNTSTTYAFTASSDSGQLSGSTYIWSGSQGSANPGKGSYSTTASVSGTTCFAEGTMIALADGTYKAVEDLAIGDILVVFNHETGRYEYAPLLTNVHAFAKAVDVCVINLYFSNGRSLRIVGEHGLFDLDAMKYVYINIENYRSFIGHNFATYENANGEMFFDSAVLTNVIITFETIKVYNPASIWHLNLVAEGMLTLSAGMVNFFEYDDNLQYNAEKMAQDIETYGLYTYEDFADYVSEEVFMAFPFKYFKVAVGKGEFTFEELLILIEFYNSSESMS